MIKASIIFITYCHERFVAEAIRSALNQDYPVLEIIVCDDASSDNTLAILQEELKNCPPHITVVEAHSVRNSGLHATFTRALHHCAGDVIIAMSGDDISLSGRVSQVVEEFEKKDDTMVVVHNWQLIDKNGQDIEDGGCKYGRRKRFRYSDNLKCIYARSPVCGASAAYRRILFDVFGDVIAGDHGEDNCFWFRGLLLGYVCYLPDKMVKWRAHANNLSNWSQALDDHKNRLKHLVWLKRHNFTPQYSRDLKIAVEHNLVSAERARDLMDLVTEDFESKRLRRYSLTAAPWKLWLASAMRLRKCSKGVKFYRKLISYYFRLKVSSSYRERKYWRKRLG